MPGDMTLLDKSYSWADARKDKSGNIDGVLSLIGKGMSLIRGRQKMGYPFKPDGRQRRGRVCGEIEVEAKLLGKRVILSKGNKRISEVCFLSNAAGIGSKKKGNVITDLFGLDDKESPVVGEVKIRDNNPWYAVVECVQQIALLRADRKHLQEWLKGHSYKKDLRGAGSWGMVIAPEKYWKKKEKEQAFQLVEELK